MAKTRSQTLNPTVKKEEHKDTSKLQRLLHRTNNVSKSKNKITKNKTHNKIHITEVKSENEDDNKALLAKPTPASRRTGSNITTEKITKLIGYIVNDKMTMTAAAKKIGISYSSAKRYYRVYKDDPEHKIPLPKAQISSPTQRVAPLKMDSVIRYIVDDGMTITQAAKKADISRNTAARYCAKYLKDPEHKIPSAKIGSSPKYCTQEAITDLIGYIVRDNMRVGEASKKANMGRNAARKYYLRYLYNKNRDIPDPREPKLCSAIRCTNNQVKSLIGYIVDDGMSVLEASVKTNMGIKAAYKYYKRYLNDPENNIPTPETSNNPKHSNPLTLDQVKNFFYYILIDKLNISQAARNANISRTSGHRLYTKYLKNPTQEINMEDMSYSTEKMEQLVKLVQNEKMDLKDAADVVHLNINIARQQYHQFLKDPQYDFPGNKHRQYTQEDVKRLIHYIEKDKVSVESAARRINMHRTSAHNYYTLYQNDPEHKIPTPATPAYKQQQQKITDKYTQIIADIYKNNPSIKPVDRNCDPELDRCDIEVKEEPMEEID